MTTYAAAVASLRAHGCEYAPATERPGVEAAADMRPEHVAWASSFATLSSGDDAVWFLSLDDYGAATDDAFPWNAFEAMSREAVMSPEDQAAVTAFWSHHRPILLSVRDGYGYLALRDDGAVVHGEEPQFEEATVVADDLDALLTAVAGRPHPGTGMVEALLFGPA